MNITGGRLSEEMFSAWFIFSTLKKLLSTEARVS